MVSLLVGELVGGDFVSWPEPGGFWREQESGGIRRNPEESGGIRRKCMNSFPTGIPAKNSCDGVQKPEFLQPLQNHVHVKNSSGKHQKKNPQESWQECFLCPKNKFLKTGIGNLGSHVLLVPISAVSPIAQRCADVCGVHARGIQPTIRQCAR